MNDYDTLLTELEQQLNELTETNTKQSEQIQKLTTVNHSLTNQNKQLQRLIDRLTTQNAKLNNENNRLRAYCKPTKNPRHGQEFWVWAVGY